ncbi:MAG: MFS transporter [Candidatus Latescibacteria bacterium]|nr:MFS transporter [Candidatus Latescibacterota bacterium]
MVESAHSERPGLMDVVADRKGQQEIKRNTRLLVLNGGLMMMAMTFVSSDLVLPAFVQTLTASSVLVGLASSLMRIGWAWPQVFISRIVEPKPRKMPLFVIAGIGRSVIWFAAGAMTFWLGANNPMTLLVAFMVLYGIATSMMGITNVPWMDIIGKSVPSTERARMFAVRRLLGGVMAMGAGVAITYILSSQSGLNFPDNYAVLFMLSGIGTGLSVWAFGVIREPIEKGDRKKLAFVAYMVSGLNLLREDVNYRNLCILQFMWAFSMMAAPFYVPFAIEGYGMPIAYVGFFVSVMQFSSIFSNALWAWVGHHKGNHALLVYGTWFLGLSIVIPLLTQWIPSQDLRPLQWAGFGVAINSQILFYSLTFVFSGFATSGMFTGRMTYVLDIAPPDRRPTYTSFMNMFMLPQGVLPILSGVLISWISYQNTFLLSLFFVPISVLLARELKDIREGPTDISESKVGT